MAQEEFQESDIIFQDNFGFSDRDVNANITCRITDCSDYQKSRCNGHFKKTRKSVPINIPEIHSDNELGYEYGEDERKVMPPHEILGRRIVGMMAFSVCSEDGRTLKGRRLWEIRDFILRLTGFLET